MSKIILAEDVAPDTPDTGKGTVYIKTDGLIYFKNDAGSEFSLSAGEGGSHTSLTDIGTNTHPEIDTHLAEDYVTTGDEPHGIPLVVLAKTTAPGATDDGADTSGNGVFKVGSRWIDITNDKEYVCLDNSTSSAVWTETTGGGGGTVSEGCRVYNSANISTVTETIKVLTFNSERWDDNDLHSTVTNTDRITIKTAGRYHVFGHIEFASSVSGVRIVILELNATTNIAYELREAAGGNNISINTVYELAVDDYVQISVWQNTGGNLDVVAGSALGPDFGVEFIST